LNDEATLRETLELLRSAGCNSEGVAGFKKAVEQYNASPPDLNLEKFPKPQGGFYSFPSVSNLVSALPHRLCNTDHAYEINCFDSALLLTHGRLKVDLLADETAGPFVVNHALTNGDFVYWMVATAADAFEFAYPEWYRNESGSFFPASLASTRPFLTASIYRFYVLPFHTSQSALPSALAKALNTAWTRMRLTFPENCELVLCQQVNLPNSMFGTGHAGVGFGTKTKYIYFEKTGGCGPFVRLDLQRREDLYPWLAAHLQEEANGGFTDFFVTFNNGAPQRLPIIESTNSSANSAKQVR
jgi:hypothetical protein